MSQETQKYQEFVTITRKGSKYCKLPDSRFGLSTIKVLKLRKGVDFGRIIV